MASLNKVLLIGNLTRDPELRYVPSGTAVTTFGIAVNRVYMSQTGEKKEDTCFVRVVVWGRRAEVCGEFLSKGSPVFIEGRLQSRSWEDQNGQKRSTIEVVAGNVQFLSKGKEKEVPSELQEQTDTPLIKEEEMKEAESAASGKDAGEEIPF